MTVLNINPLAVIVSAVAMMALGFLWYGPIFGKMWMAAIGKTPEEISSPGPAYGVTTVAAVVHALAMAMVISAASAHDLMAGITLGAIVGIGFISTSQLSNSVFESRPWTVTFLFAGYQIVGSIIMGAIIGFWR